MQLTRYGFGDPQTWGGRSPEPSDYDYLYEKVEEELSDKLYTALQNIGMEEVYDVAVSSDDFERLVTHEVDARMRQADEDKAEAIIAAREWDC